MALQAGERDQIITFERLIATPDGVGGQSVLWGVLGQAWAAVKWVSGGETHQGDKRAGAMRATFKHRFTVLAAEAEALNLTPSDRIVWDGQPYNITERPRRIRTSPHLEIVAQSGAAMKL